MTFATRAVPFRHNRRSACRFVLPHVAVALRGYRLGSNIARTCLVALPRSGDLFLGAERLLVATREWRGLRCRRCAHHARCSGHPNRGINGVLEIDGVVGSGLGSIARLHAIVSGAYFASPRWRTIDLASCRVMACPPPAHTRARVPAGWD